MGTGKGIESIPASRAGSESPDFYLFSKGKLMIFNSIFRDFFRLRAAAPSAQKGDTLRVFTGDGTEVGRSEP